MPTSRRSNRPPQEMVITPSTRRAASADFPFSVAARHQFECAMLGCAAVLKSAEAMHRFLLDSTQGARKRHEAIRSRVHAAAGLEQMAALQAELWRFDTDLANRYWEEVADAATHMNAELFDQTSKALEWWADDAQALVPALTERTMAPDLNPFGGLFRNFIAAATPARTPA